METNEKFVDTLLGQNTVYYNYIKFNNQVKIIHSIAGCLIRRYSNFYFYPISLNQVKS